MNRTGNVNQKLLLVLGLVSLVFFGLYTLMNFTAQRDCLIQERQMQNRFLAETIFTGFKNPMARGDVDAINQQMTEFAKSLPDSEIHFFGSDRQISFSTDPGQVGKNLSTQGPQSGELNSHLEKLLTTGSNGDSFPEKDHGNRHLSVLLPSLNEQRCHHCHGDTRKVLGGLLVRQDAEEAFCRVEEFLYRNVLLGIVGFIILLLIQYKSVAHLVITPIQNQVGEILTCAGQVEREAGQIESSSRHLSDGTTSLAASAEETSASVTEVAGNIRKNAEYSGKLDTLMQEHGKTFHQAEKEMSLLGASMKEVNNVTSEMKKIIRTIDEIAFQTNLLALNAAVEAARAGTAGAGFGVVADEVRNLALRSAEAARNTTDLIEGISTRVQSGTDVMTRTEATFREVIGSLLQAQELVKRIAEATRNQAESIDQINKAVLEIDQVTQNHSATAEETSASSVELAAESNRLRQVADRLGQLVGILETGKDSRS